MCPLNISAGPPPAPASVPSTFARPSSTCCHCTCRPSSSNVWATNRAISSSLAGEAGDRDRLARPVDEPVAVDRERSSAHVRQDPLAEEPNLLVPPVAPELEHDVGAAGLAVLLDRRDAVVGRAGDRLALVQQRVRDLRPWPRGARPAPSPRRPAGSRPARSRRGRAACRPRPGCSAPCSRGTCRRSRARRRGRRRGRPRGSRRRSCSRCRCRRRRSRVCSRRRRAW